MLLVLSTIFLCLKDYLHSGELSPLHYPSREKQCTDRENSQWLERVFKMTRVIISMHTLTPAAHR